MESNTEQYIENIAGSPYINEVDLNPLKKIKSGVRNFVNKYINPQGNTQTATTNPTDKDFIKIVETVVTEINKKINNDPLIKKPAAPIPTQIPSTIQNTAPETDDGNHHISSMDESDEGEDDEPTTGKASTKLHVADTEEKAGGWLSLFRGQYRKSRKFGIDIKISKVIRLSNNKFKKLENIRWVNNSHENKILLRYQDVTDLVNKKLSGIKMASGDRNRSGINEADAPEQVSTGPKEIVLFKFYDDQINPKSASYNSKTPPTIAVLLEQANPYSKLVDRVKNSPELTTASPAFMESLYHVEQQKMIEFKGHQEVASNIKFHIDDDKNVLYLGAFSGKTESMPLNVVNSILEKGEAANNNDDNLKDTGLDFLDFVDTLKAAGLKTDDLLTPLAKQHFGGTSQSTNINPDNGLPNTKGVQDAYLALTALGNKKSDVERWLTDIIKVDGDGLDSEAYTKKALKKPSTSNPAPQNTTPATPATPTVAPVQASAPSVSKSKSTGMTDAQKYSIEGNYVIGPDPKYINNSKKGVKSWKIANSKDANGNIQWNTVPSEVQDIINHNSELRSDLNKSIEGLRNNSIQIDESFNDSYKLKNILTK